MAGAGGAASMEQFEAYFQRADLDRDGRISGSEAVAFFKGSNLPQDVLAKIWTHADQNRTGYLGRPEFYNALKLVTVAQRNRELTPDIVKAALYGPASAKIPAPQINLATMGAPQPNSVAAAPAQQTGVASLSSSQSFGFRGQGPSSTSVNQQFGATTLSTGMNQQLRQAPPSIGSANQYYGQVQPSSTTVTSQFGQIQPSSTVTTQQFGQFPPSSAGLNQQLGQVRPSSNNMNSQFGYAQPSATGANQQFGYAQPSTMGANQQFGYVQPSSTGANQLFGQAPFSMTNQQFPSPSNQPVQLPVSMPTSALRPPHSAGGPIIPPGDSTVRPGLTNSNNDWLGGKNSAASNLAMPNAGSSPSIGPVDSNSLDQLSSFSSAAAGGPKGLVSSVHKSASDPNVYSANNLPTQQVSSAQKNPSSSLATSSPISSGTSGLQPSPKPDPFEAFQSSFGKPSTGLQASQTRSLPNLNQHTHNQVTSSPSSLGIPAATGSSTAEQSQDSWPKMTRASIQKYAKVFIEVDTGRSGRIREQAHKLFMSWRLPREVLKQVWDLSDQDSDGMLSLREFCIALYLMERYREGQSLPSTLPNSVMLDETLSSLTGPPVSYGNAAWGMNTDFRQTQALPGVQQVAPAGLRPPIQQTPTQVDGIVQFNQQRARGFATDNSQILSIGQDNSLDSKGQDADQTKEKNGNDENMLLDSKEKLEYYRTKMQDLVLYKSRCDNRLNEITERARADKAEAEILEKKYQEKYKQVSEVHSKLTLEEASFREIQERKMELHQAITKMEQGGSADGILQVRADRIQMDLEGLLKALADRCKKHNLEIKSSKLIELPPGWAPGVPEAALIWDEDWDKFEDEGFSFDVAIPENVKSASGYQENSSPAHSHSPDSVLNGDATSEKPFSTLVSAFETESMYSGDESKSLQGSPGRVNERESPSQESTENHFRRNSDGDTDTHRSFDEPIWGNFDNNDDIDSVWGFNSKDSDQGKHEEKHFFGSNEFVASPDRTDSPRKESTFQKNTSSLFEDSVPNSPLSRAANSPSRFSVDSRDHFFDNFSRYDSFSVQGGGSLPARENLTRFDSISSTSGFNHSNSYSFDDSDPFGSSGPFKVSSETPKKGSEWSSM